MRDELQRTGFSIRRRRRQARAQVNALPLARDRVKAWKLVGAAVLGALLLGLLTLAMYFVVGTSRRRFDQRKAAYLEPLREQGDFILRQVEAYQAGSGTYPERLEQIDLEGLVPVVGSWSYHRTDDDFYIIGGDYGECGWELHYLSASRQWSVRQ